MNPAKLYWAGYEDAWFCRGKDTFLRLERSYCASYYDACDDLYDEDGEYA